MVAYCYGSELQSEYICCSKLNHHIDRKFHCQSDTQVMQHRGIPQVGPLLLQQLFHRLIWDHILLLIRNFVIEGFDLSASHLDMKSVETLKASLIHSGGTIFNLAACMRQHASKKGFYEPRLPSQNGLHFPLLFCRKNDVIHYVHVFEWTMFLERWNRQRFFPEIDNVFSTWWGGCKNLPISML